DRYKNGPLGTNAGSGPYFFPDGRALAAGSRRTNPEYARVLRLIANNGPSAFYSGEIARNIIKAVRSGEIRGGLSLEDPANYKVLVKPALCGSFREYRICSAPPEASGGVAMNQIMSLYAGLMAKSGSSSEATKLRDFVLAQQLAYADRDHYVADP